MIARIVFKNREKSFRATGLEPATYFFSKKPHKKVYNPDLFAFSYSCGVNSVEIGIGKDF